ncbi:MAG: endopeptidase La [Deltaproteobacteria bacterium]|nr:endopeptidase La [Deltaproteobacteria bacterium]
MLFNNDAASPKPADGSRRVVPLLPLRDIIVFPHMVVPLFVGREKSISALEEAMRHEKDILLSAQKRAKTNEPTPEDIHAVGTVGTVVQLLRLPDGTVKVLVEGKKRARILRFVPNDDFFLVEAEVLEEPTESHVEAQALMRSVQATFETYVKLNKKIPPEMLMSVASIEEPARLADTIASHLTIKSTDKQQILEQVSPTKRLERLFELMQAEIEIMQVQKKIRTRVKRQMEKTQKEYYLNEQMQAIQKELGEKDEFKSELLEMEEKLKGKKLSPEAAQKTKREMRKLKMMSPMSAEATVVRNYLDWMLAVPWEEYTEDKLDVVEAQKILDEDHHGLKAIKSRILEYLAVRKLTGISKGPILCFVGPPGVGKTSLARSIARSMGRKFIRISLGGVRDEAEIRGHRRTYIGALPGKLIQALRRAGSSNPVILLDEVDKMSQDFRGDPASALLEVLDPEQNHVFNDHYLDVDYDLSKVMFICTGNNLQGIPIPLQDRLEIIRLAGYTEAEKLAIARQYLIPRQKEANGLKNVDVKFAPEALARVLHSYTREAGVRNLEREIATCLRKVAKNLVREQDEKNHAAAVAAPAAAPDAVDLEAEEKTAVTERKEPAVSTEHKPLTAPMELKDIQPVSIDEKMVRKFLGVRRFRTGRKETENQVGLSTGLAWTQVGGDLLVTECALMPGKGKLIITGKLGDVMQESAQAAMSYVRSRADSLGLPRDFYANVDVHLHVPEGATPKDGPSAGITLTTALVSALTKIPVRSDVAMTGEITLRGRVLPIGGLKEKGFAAYRGGIKTLIVPRENVKDLVEIPRAIRRKLNIVPVEHMDEVLKVALALEDPNRFFEKLQRKEAPNPEPLPAPPVTAPVAAPVPPLPADGPH